MASCPVPPKPEMYGLGIRVAFYIQWIGTIGFNYMDQTALPDLRLLGLCLSASMTLALLIQAVGHGLRPSEMFVMVVLATGAHMFLVPVYIWRVITGCRCYWDPAYWTEEEPLRIYRVVNFTTIFTGGCVAIWFFAAYLPGLDEACQQYGFMFGKWTMKSWPFVVLNTLLHVGVVTVCTLILVVKWGSKLPSWESSRRRRRRRRENYNHVRFLAALHIFSDCMVWAMLVVTVELSIAYNNLSAANDINTTAQLLTLFISIGACLRAYWLHAVDFQDGDNGEELVQYYGWPMTYEDWWTLQEYQQAVDDAREGERWSRDWRRQMRRAYRGWIH